MNKIICPNSHVQLHYSIALENGTEIESSFDDDPLDMTMGDGQLTEGMELAIFNLTEGDKQILTLTAEQGFGHYDESNIHRMQLSNFPQDLCPDVGLVFSFDSSDGDEVPGTIVKIEGENVDVDFNHPLAGQPLVFSIEILTIDNNDVI